MKPSEITHFYSGTWIEPEELCYPNGGMKRRAMALFPDRRLRIVHCGIPDTYFSIPCRKTKTHGRGYLAMNEGVLEFRPYPGQW